MPVSFCFMLVAARNKGVIKVGGAGVVVPVGLTGELDQEHIGMQLGGWRMSGLLIQF